MKYNVILHDNFKKEVKPLLKKYPSLKSDLQKLLDNIDKELKLATDLGDGFKKIKIAIKSKGKGSSGGGRIITHETIVSINDTNLVFGSIYNKGEYNTIDTAILRKILEM
jgi:mRNA-degrading endonuclease RelE of RelBE toxin-antitoxin system